MIEIPGRHRREGNVQGMDGHGFRGKALAIENQIENQIRCGEESKLKKCPSTSEPREAILE
jgi:hypothetical protein